MPAGGLRGRVGLFELLVTTDPIRQLAHDRESSWAIQQAAVKNGMRSLRDDGWVKVLDGRTTVDEVSKITKSSEVGLGARANINQGRQKVSIDHGGHRGAQSGQASRKGAKTRRR